MRSMVFKGFLSEGEPLEIWFDGQPESEVLQKSVRFVMGYSRCLVAVCLLLTLGEASEPDFLEFMKTEVPRSVLMSLQYAYCNYHIGLGLNFGQKLREVEQLWHG